jgi:hypothetical protein
MAVKALILSFLLWQQLWTDHSLLVPNASAPPHSHTSHGTPVNKILVYLATFSPAYQLICPPLLSSLPAFYLSFIHTSHTSRSLYSLTPSVIHILTKPHSFVLGTMLSFTLFVWPLFWYIHNSLSNYCCVYIHAILWDRTAIFDW